MKKLKLFATNTHLFKKDDKNNNKKEGLRKKALQIYKTDKYYKIITMPLVRHM